MILIVVVLVGVNFIWVVNINVIYIFNCVVVFSIKLIGLVINGEKFVIVLIFINIR